MRVFKRISELLVGMYSTGASRTARFTKELNSIASSFGLSLGSTGPFVTTGAVFESLNMFVVFGLSKTVTLTTVFHGVPFHQAHPTAAQV